MECEKGKILDPKTNVCVTPKRLYHQLWSASATNERFFTIADDEDAAQERMEGASNSEYYFDQIGTELVPVSDATVIAELTPEEAEFIESKIGLEDGALSEPDLEALADEPKLTRIKDKIRGWV